MLGLGIPELILILVIVMVIFGVGKLPQIGSALGKTIKGFREESKGLIDDVEKEASGIPSTANNKAASTGSELLIQTNAPETEVAGVNQSTRSTS